MPAPSIASHEGALHGGCCGQPLDDRPPLAANATIPAAAMPSGSSNSTRTGTSTSVSSSAKGESVGKSTASEAAARAPSASMSAASVGSKTALRLSVLRARKGMLARLFEAPLANGRRARVAAPPGSSIRNTLAPTSARILPAYSVAGCAISSTCRAESRGTLIENSDRVVADLCAHDPSD
jgi:hypothetical protein